MIEEMAKCGSTLLFLALYELIDDVIFLDG